MRGNNAGTQLISRGRPAAIVMGMVIIGLANAALASDPMPIHVFDMNYDPGWTTEGMWEFGQPMGLGGTEFGYPDPDSGATGVNVYGYNLQGDYPIDIAPPYWLTTTALDCTGYENITLQFQRWLNSDWQPWVKSSIAVSNNGVDWIEIWENDSGEIVSDSWTLFTYNISAVANDQPMVYIRWGHEVLTDGTWAYSGWNLDDIEIWGSPIDYPCTADVNYDQVVDIDDLFAVLAMWGGCGDCTEDINDDGTVDIDDVFEVLADWGPCE